MIVGTATLEDSTAAFANDPRADPGCLRPANHEKLAQFRVSKVALLEKPTSAFSFKPPKQFKFQLEQRDQGDWQALQ